MARTKLPLGVSARFPNRSGAFVDVVGYGAATWKCGGCPETGGWRQRPVDAVSREAQAHADECSGLPNGRR